MRILYNQYSTGPGGQPRAPSMQLNVTRRPSELTPLHRRVTMHEDARPLCKFACFVFNHNLTIIIILIYISALTILSQHTSPCLSNKKCYSNTLSAKMVYKNLIYILV